MNVSTDLDETVTRGDLFLVGFATFFIFVLPKMADLKLQGSAGGTSSDPSALTLRAGAGNGFARTTEHILIER